MDINQRYKGRFIKKSVLKKRDHIKTLASRLKSNKTTKPECGIPNGNRIVNIRQLAKQMYCCRCKEKLSLADIKEESLIGLNCTWKIPCEKCLIINTVSPTKKQINPGNVKLDINKAGVFGAVHAGVGCIEMNKLLSCLNLPAIDAQLFKKYEQEIGPIIEKVQKKIQDEKNDN